MQKEHTTITISNKLVEVTIQSSSPIIYRHALGGRKSTQSQSIENYKANVKKSINRARKKITRLLECNFYDQYAFVTLTFKPSKELDVTDVKSCNKKFADFKKRLAYYLKMNNLPNFEYLGVLEFQDQNNGAIHYHMICNLTEIPLAKLQELWQYGFVDRAIIKSNASENEKIAYYLKKGISDPRLNGNKRYFHSHGLKQPITFVVENLEEFYNKLDKCKPTLKTGGTFHTPFSGETKYENYYVEDAKELMNYVQEH
jgi:hypothetical protein